MRNSYLLLAGLLLLTAVTPVRGQEVYPSFEAFGGFSIMSFGGEEDAGVVLDRNNFWGWQGSAAFHLTPLLAAVADLGGQYKSIEVPGGDVRFASYQYLFGPRAHFRGGQGAGFVHFLLGGERASGGGISDTGLALGLGGGLDWTLGSEENWGFRLIQFDWIPARFGGEWSTDTFRIGIGLFFRPEM